jgi:hypothetical protein
MENNLVFIYVNQEGNRGVSCRNGTRRKSAQKVSENCRNNIMIHRYTYQGKNLKLDNEDT